MSFKYIQEHYKIPIKRGMRVRQQWQGKPGQEGVVLSAKAHVAVRLNTGRRVVDHPYGYDYLIDGQWLSGEKLCKARNTFIDAVNARWGGRQDEAKALMDSYHTQMTDTGYPGNSAVNQFVRK